MSFTLLRRLITTAVGLGLVFALTRQCRKPTGWLGRRITRAMNLGHAPLTAWGLSHADIGQHARILDIGCGGGRTLRTLAEMASAAHVDGVDYAPASVAMSRESNADLIEAGRVSVQQASVSQLPFPDASFDLITAVETHYYWPDLDHDLREVLRVLKPGGQFVLIAETYRGPARSWLLSPVMRVLGARYLSLDQHRAALAEAGFAGVETHTHRVAGWICVVAARPNGARST
jgi:ubiquinone/menaquinone biosynthesis C-methylase UbiE